MANNAFVYIEKTLPKVVDKIFTVKSQTERLLGASDVKLSFLDAKTIKIFKVKFTGLTNYRRAGYGNENISGAAASEFETFTLSQERWVDIPIDKLDTIEDAETVLGHMISDYYKEMVVPEVDAYRFAKLCSYTNVTFGNRVDENIAANTIISKINAGISWFENNQVEEPNRVIYVSPAVMSQIRSTTELYRKLSQEEYRSDDISFTINKYEQSEIVVVPNARFASAIVTNDNGYAPADGAKLINFLMVDKRCCVPVIRVDKTKVYDSDSTYLRFAGYRFTSLLNHDIFVPDNKVVGIYASVSTTSATGVVGGLLVNASEGAAQGNTKINSVFAQPNSIMWDALYLNTAAAQIKVGDTVVAGTNVTAVTIGADVTPNATHNQIVATLGGKAVAVSKDFTTTLPKKA